MQIHCENCGTVIPAANINIQEKLAVCPRCGSVFSFADHLARDAQRRKFKPPQSLVISETDEALDIRFRWMQILKPEEHLITVLCGAGAFILGSLAVAVTDHGIESIAEGVFGIGFTLAALACLYVVLILLINKVHITLDDDTIRVKNTPLLGTTRVNRADVVRVECQLAWYNREDPNSEFIDYHVRLVCHDGRTVNLVTLRRDLAFYVAQVIEDYLYGDKISYDISENGRDEVILDAEEDAAERVFTKKSGGG